MATIVQTSDFVGEYKVSQSRFTELARYIETYEKYYLIRLLGKDLYDLFIADLTLVTPQVPQTLPYQSIFNPFEQDNNSCLIVSEGIKQMLVMFIYFHYVRDMAQLNTTTGVVNNVNENSTNPSYNGYNLTEAYNKAIDTYQSIQWYINENDTDYPDYNGQSLFYTSGI
jgi:hypothetical protein